MPEDLMKAERSKLPDLVQEIVNNKEKKQVREKDTNDNAKKALENIGEDSGMVKKRITLFEKKFW